MVVIRDVKGAQPSKPSKKVLIAHRGAYGTSRSKRRGYRIRDFEKGADYVEQDLAVPRDGV